MSEPLAQLIMSAAMVFLGCTIIYTVWKVKQMNDENLKRLDDVTNRLSGAVTAAADRIAAEISRLSNVPADVAARIKADTDRLSAAADALDAIGKDEAEPVPAAVDDHVATAEAAGDDNTDTVQG